MKALGRILLVVATVVALFLLALRWVEGHREVFR